MWVLDEEEGRDEAGPPPPVEIRYDSQYACDMAQRMSEPKHEIDLVNRVAALVERVASTRLIEFVHVKGHCGERGNDWADRLADRGASGAVSPHSQRWAPPPPPGPARDPRQRQCHICQEFFRDSPLARHQEDCRGPGDANLRCRYCPNRKLLGSLVARRNHEAKCSHR